MWQWCLLTKLLYSVLVLTNNIEPFKYSINDERSKFGVLWSQNILHHGQPFHLSQQEHPQKVSQDAACIYLLNVLCCSDDGCWVSSGSFPQSIILSLSHSATIETIVLTSYNGEQRKHKRNLAIAQHHNFCNLSSQVTPISFEQFDSYFSEKFECSNIKGWGEKQKVWRLGSVWWVRDWRLSILPD